MSNEVEMKKISQIYVVNPSDPENGYYALLVLPVEQVEGLQEVLDSNISWMSFSDYSAFINKQSKKTDEEIKGDEK